MIQFRLELEGWARKLSELSEDDLIEDGLLLASKQTREEMKVSYDASGLRVVSGDLRNGVSDGALIDLDTTESSLTLSPKPDQETIASVQDKRVTLFTLSPESQERVAEKFIEGVLED